MKGTAGGVSFVLDEGLLASPTYRWTLSHTMAMDDPLELFPTHSSMVTGDTDFVEYDPAYAIKFTILRLRPSGSAGDGDIFGAQQ